MTESTGAGIDTKKDRKVYLEVLRIIAFVCVMFNHTGPYGFEMFTGDRPALLRIICIMLSNLAKTGVPVFFMISGALLIPKKEDIRSLLCRRVLKMITILIVISFLYYLRLYIQHPEYGFSLKFFIETVFRSPIVTPLWFMYVYIAFLLMLPLLRRMALEMSETEYKYLMVLCMIFWYAMPVAGYVMKASSYLNIPLLATGIVYPLAGYCLDTVFGDRIGKRSTGSPDGSGVKISVIYAVLLIVLNGLLCAGMTWLAARRTGEWGYEYIEGFVFVPAVLIFFAVKYVFAGMEASGRFKSAAVYTGGCIFTVYLFEEMLREDIFMAIYRTWGGHDTDILLFIPYALMLLGAGVLLAAVIRLVPGLRKWV